MGFIVNLGNYTAGLELRMPSSFPKKEIKNLECLPGTGLIDRLRMTGQKMAKIAYFIVYISRTTLRMPSWDCFFWVWILSSSPAILKKLRIYERIMTLTIERSGNASQNCWFIKCMQKLEKSIFQYFLIWILCHKQQDPGKSWKIILFNTFLIKILIQKSSHKHQDAPENWKKQNFNNILIRKYTKIPAKAGKSKFQYFFI